MRAIPQIFVLILTPFTNAHAQQQPIAAAGEHRSGGWWGIGMTFGSVSESSLISGGKTATVNVRAGGTMSPHFRLGGELDLRAGAASEYLGALALVGTIYPAARGDFFLKVGIGARVLGDFEYVYIPIDLLGIVGVGYDLRPSGGRVSLTPFLQLAVGPTILSLGDPVRETFRRQWQIGLAATWH